MCRQGGRLGFVVRDWLPQLWEWAGPKTCKVLSGLEPHPKSTGLRSRAADGVVSI